MTLKEKNESVPPKRPQSQSFLWEIQPDYLTRRPILLKYIRMTDLLDHRNIRITVVSKTINEKTAPHPTVEIISNI